MLSKFIKRAFYYSKIAFNNGRHIIITGKKGDGLTQIAKWIAEYNSKNKKNVCFVFTSGISVSDLLGKYIPNSQTDSGAQLIEWKDGPLTNGIKNVSKLLITFVITLKSNPESLIKSIYLCTSFKLLDFIAF